MSAIIAHPPDQSTTFTSIEPSKQGATVDGHYVYRLDRQTNKRKAVELQVPDNPASKLKVDNTLCLTEEIFSSPPKRERGEKVSDLVVDDHGGTSSHASNVTEGFAPARGLRGVLDANEKKYGSLGDFRRSPTDSKKDTACLRSIFAQKIALSYCKHSKSTFRVKTFPGMIEIKLKTKKALGSNPPKVSSQRGKIKQFSTKSRRRLIKTLCRFPNSFGMRFELTFADDVMEGLNQEERSKKGSKYLHRLQTWIERNNPLTQLIWKREWEPRKSGSLKDQVLPHYHFMMYNPGFSKEDYENTWAQFAIKWVRLTGTKDGNAYSVALHQRSRGYLKPDDEYVNYFGKYISKGRFEEGEGVGRFWGEIGNLEQAEGENIALDDYQVMQLKRRLRGYLRSTQKRTKRLPDGSKIKIKPKRRYEDRLKYGSFEGFIAMRKNTIERIVKFVERR